MLAAVFHLDPTLSRFHKRIAALFHTAIGCHDDRYFSGLAGVVRGRSDSRIKHDTALCQFLRCLAVNPEKDPLLNRALPLFLCLSCEKQV